MHCAVRALSAKLLAVVLHHDGLLRHQGVSRIMMHCLHRSREFNQGHEPCRKGTLLHVAMALFTQRVHVWYVSMQTNSTHLPLVNCSTYYSMGRTTNQWPGLQCSARKACMLTCVAINGWPAVSGTATGAACCGIINTILCCFLQAVDTRVSPSSLDCNIDAPTQHSEEPSFAA